LTEIEIKIGLKINKAGKFLKDITTNSRGELLQKYVTDSGELRVIGGKEIDRYGIRGTKGLINKKYALSEKCKISPNSILTQNIVAHITQPYDHIKIIACIPQKL
jgi:hypothetical protein